MADTKPLILIGHQIAEKRSSKSSFALVDGGAACPCLCFDVLFASTFFGVTKRAAKGSSNESPAISMPSKALLGGAFLLALALFEVLFTLLFDFSDNESSFFSPAGIKSAHNSSCCAAIAAFRAFRKPISRSIINALIFNCSLLIISYAILSLLLLLLQQQNIIKAAIKCFSPPLLSPTAPVLLSQFVPSHLSHLSPVLFDADAPVHVSRNAYEPTNNLHRRQVVHTSSCLIALRRSRSFFSSSMRRISAELRPPPSPSGGSAGVSSWPPTL